MWNVFCEFHLTLTCCKRFLTAGQQVTFIDPEHLRTGLLTWPFRITVMILLLQWPSNGWVLQGKLWTLLFLSVFPISFLKVRTLLLPSLFSLGQFLLRLFRIGSVVDEARWRALQVSLTSLSAVGIFFSLYYACPSWLRHQYTALRPSFMSFLIIPPRLCLFS